MMGARFIQEYDPSIEYLELFAVCAGILTWEFELRNIRMCVHCDNMAVVHMINSLSSSCKHCMYLIRLLVLNGLQFNRRIIAQHIFGIDNEMSDALSRGQLDHFRHMAPPGMKSYPEKISDKCWPLLKLWEQ